MRFVQLFQNFKFIILFKLNYIKAADWSRRKREKIKRHLLKENEIKEKYSSKADFAPDNFLPPLTWVTR